MPVKRRLGKRNEHTISDEAIRLFEEMRQLGCSGRNPCFDSALGNTSCECSGCQRWRQLHPFLRRELGEKMWRYPTISRWPPDQRRDYEPDSEQARWLVLEQASAARRQRATVPEPEPTAARTTLP